MATTPWLAGASAALIIVSSAAGGCGEPTSTSSDAGTGPGGAASGGDDTGGGGQGGGETTGGAGGGGVGAGGSGGSGGSGGAAPDDVAAFCQAYAPAFCAAFFSCCPSQDSLDNLGGTEAACVAQLTGDCIFGDQNYNAIPGLVAQGTAALDQSRLATCVGLMADQAASCDTHILLLNYRCLTSFVGNVPDGQPCGVADDVGFAACTAGSWCEGNSAPCEPFLPGGADCSSAGECNVNDGMTCLENLTCAPRVDAGMPCVKAGDCLSGSCNVQSGTCNDAGAPALCGFIVN